MSEFFMIHSLICSTFDDQGICLVMNVTQKSVNYFQNHAVSDLQVSVRNSIQALPVGKIIQNEKY